MLQVGKRNQENKAQENTEKLLHLEQDTKKQNQTTTAANKYTSNIYSTF